MKILNGQQAFAELSAGKKIEARLIHPDHGFQPLDRFTATVFIQSEYEFRIAVTYMTIGEMQVPEPINEPPAKGTQCFLPSVLTEALSKSFKWKDSETDLILMNRGQVHLVQEHAETHALALIKISGGSIEVATETQSDSPNEEQPIKTNKTADRSDWPASQVPSQNYIDMWLNRAKDEPTRRNLDGMKASIDHNWDNLDPDHQLQARQIYSDFETLVEQAESEAIETDPVKLVEKFTAQISQFTKVDDVLSFRHVFMANGNLDQKDQQHLCKLCEDKVLELDPEQYTPKPEQSSSDNLSVTELHRLQQEAEKLVQSKKVVDADTEYENLLTDLLDRVTNGASPAEVNAVMKYTKSWTEDQRKPLLNAVHNRLQELNPPLENASLSVKIENAKDLTELDALEIDVSACDEFIQEKLMELIHKRRTELDVFALPLGEP